jgi:hypothetical protein
VLDDLKASGYEMLDRKIGLNLQQTKLFLDKLAKFHAASAVCYRKVSDTDKFRLTTSLTHFTDKLNY